MGEESTSAGKSKPPAIPAVPATVLAHGPALLVGALVLYTFVLVIGTHLPQRSSNSSTHESPASANLPVTVSPSLQRIDSKEPPLMVSMCVWPMKSAAKQAKAALLDSRKDSAAAGSRRGLDSGFGLGLGLGLGFG